MTEGRTIDDPDPHYLRYRAWRAKAARLCRVTAEPPAASGLPSLVDVAGIRRRLGQLMGGPPISQAAFARRYGFSLAAVRDWEQGRRRPSVSARVLLLAIDRDPHLIDVAIEAAIAARDGDGGPDLEMPVVRPSSLPFVVQHLGRKRRSGAAA